MEGIFFAGETVDSSYSEFLLHLKNICLAFSLYFGITYLIFYFRIPSNFISFEHTFISILSVFLILFNDPLSLITLMYPNYITLSLSTVQLMSFLSLLIVFWVIMMERIHKETIMLKTYLLSKNKIILYCLIGLLMNISGVAMNLQFKYYPGFHINSEYPITYQLLMFFSALMIGFILIKLLYSSYWTIRKWNKIIPRHKFFFLFSFYFILLILFLIVSSFY